jgi:hypothetical protein
MSVLYYGNLEQLYLKDCVVCWFDDGDINDVLGMYNLTNVYCLVLCCVTKGMVQVKTEW